MYKRIKEIADKKKIQQKEIAEALDVGPNTVNNWFQGNTSMKAEQIPLLAKVLRVRIEQLFEEVGTPLRSNYQFSETKLDVTEDGCAMCREKDAEISKLKSELIESQKETIAAMRGETKSNQANCG